MGDQESLLGTLILDIKWDELAIVNPIFSFRKKEERKKEEGGWGWWLGGGIGRGRVCNISEINCYGPIIIYIKWIKVCTPITNRLNQQPNNKYSECEDMCVVFVVCA